MMLATVGMDPYTGTPRFAGDFLFLWDGPQPDHRGAGAVRDPRDDRAGGEGRIDLDGLARDREVFLSPAVRGRDGGAAALVARAAHLDHRRRGRHDPGPRLLGRRLVLLRPRGADLEDAGALRQGRGRRRDRAGDRQQRARRRRAAADAVLRHPGELRHGGADGRVPDPRHPARPDHDHRAARSGLDADLGAGGRQPDRGDVPAVHHALGGAAHLRQRRDAGAVHRGDGGGRLLRQRRPVAEPGGAGGAERHRLRAPALQLAARAVRDRHRARQDRRGIAAQGAGAVGAALLHAAAVAGADRPDRAHHRLCGVSQRAAARAPSSSSRWRHEIDPRAHDARDARDLHGDGRRRDAPIRRRRASCRSSVGIPAIALCLLQLALDLYRRRAPEAEDNRRPLKQAEDQVARIAGRRVQFDMPSENAMFTESTHDERETRAPRDHRLGLLPRADRRHPAVRLPDRGAGLPDRLPALPGRDELAQRADLWRPGRARDVCAVREGAAGVAARGLPHRLLCRTARLPERGLHRNFR